MNYRLPLEVVAFSVLIIPFGLMASDLLLLPLAFHKGEWRVLLKRERFLGVGGKQACLFSAEPSQSEQLHEEADLAELFYTQSGGVYNLDPADIKSSAVDLGPHYKAVRVHYRPTTSSLFSSKALPNRRFVWVSLSYALKRMSERLEDIQRDSESVWDIEEEGDDDFCVDLDCAQLHPKTVQYLLQAREKLQSIIDDSESVKMLKKCVSRLGERQQTPIASVVTDKLPESPFSENKQNPSEAAHKKENLDKSIKPTMVSWFSSRYIPFGAVLIFIGTGIGYYVYTVASTEQSTDHELLS